MMAEMRDVTLELDGVLLGGALGVPSGAAGLVLFAHGSGSSRFSPRNTFVAEVLRRAGIATLLFDLLTAAEDVDYDRRFDIELLAHRLAEATGWVLRQSELDGLPIGYFGASTGSAAALRAAAVLPDIVRAVVSRGGRPDLANDILGQVQAPTLLLVGGDDEGVIELNREAYAKLHAPKELVIIPGATHLFEEPGTLEQVADLAANWFKRHLSPKERK